MTGASLWSRPRRSLRASLGSDAMPPALIAANYMAEAARRFPPKQ